MAKIATQAIKANGQRFKPGDTVSGLSPEIMKDLQDSGAVEDSVNKEPSIKDTEETWRDFLVAEGSLPEEEAAEMDKAALLEHYTSTDKDEE